MIKKVSLFLLLGLLVLGGVSTAAADTQPLYLAISYEEALNVGDSATFAALFADDAVYYRWAGGGEVVGRDAISEMLAGHSRPGRRFEVVSANMGDEELILSYEISDHGIVWGRQTVRAEIEDGLMQSMELVAFRFLF